MDRAFGAAQGPAEQTGHIPGGGSQRGQWSCTFE